MEKILISVFGTLILSIMIILLILLIKAMNKKNSVLSGDNNITQESLKLMSEEIKNFTMEKNENVKSDLKDLIKSETSQLPEIRSKIENVNSLLFQNNKAGKSGEYLLERIFENVSGKLNEKNILAERQYTLVKKNEEGKNLVVDLLLKGEGSKHPNIAIDSKFSVKAFNKIIEGDADEKAKDTEFKNSIKNRIKETSKYVSIEDNIPYAIMFIPSESITSFIHDKHPDLFEYGLNEKVIIASPSSLYTILFSVENYMNLFEKINGNEKIIKSIGILQNNLLKNDTYFFELKKAIKKMNEAWEKINKNFSNIGEQYEEILANVNKSEKH